MLSKNPTILICDDDRNLCILLEEILNQEGYDTEIVHSGNAALQAVSCRHHDLILLDLMLPDMSGLEILRKIQHSETLTQTVMISGECDIQTAVKATQAGAYDFLEKPLDYERVLITLKNALDRSRLESEKRDLLKSVLDRYRMVGEGAAMKSIQHLILKASQTNSKVLIEGPNGTGKELVARAIHYRSQRRTGPFVAVNCAAVPENLIESELFGYQKGAFTGAVSNKPGRFEIANGGTMFLDEIGDMSLMTQAKVLRVLEESVIEPIGGHETVLMDVRIIAATNKRLREEIKKGNFREDLYFRLNVLNIQVPPLSERKEDIPLLIRHYVDYFCNDHGVPLKEVHPEALVFLQNHPWPGNIRELKNAVEKIVALAEPRVVHRRDVEAILDIPSCDDACVGQNLPLKDARDAFEKKYIKSKLYATGWNVTRSADLLGVPRTYLHKLIRKYKIMPPQDNEKRSMFSGSLKGRNVASA